MNEGLLVAGAVMVSVPQIGKWRSDEGILIAFGTILVGAVFVVAGLMH